MDFDNRKVYGDTSITDGLVFTQPAVVMVVTNMKSVVGRIEEGGGTQVSG